MHDGRIGLRYRSVLLLALLGVIAGCRKSDDGGGPPPSGASKPAGPSTQDAASTGATEPASVDLDTLARGVDLLSDTLSKLQKAQIAEILVSATKDANRNGTPDAVDVRRVRNDIRAILNDEQRPKLDAAVAIAARNPRFVPRPSTEISLKSQPLAAQNPDGTPASEGISVSAVYEDGKFAGLRVDSVQPNNLLASLYGLAPQDVVRDVGPFKVGDQTLPDVNTAKDWLVEAAQRRMSLVVERSGSNATLEPNARR